MFRFVFCLLAVSAGSVAGSEAKSTLLSQRGIVLPAVAAERKSWTMLRVCNGYPYSQQLDMYIGKKKLIPDPLKYKDCRDVKQLLGHGDQIIARDARNEKGTFKMTGTPTQTPSLLLLVLRPDGDHPNRMSFMSHAFAIQDSAQVAVLDIFGGRPAQGGLRVRDRTPDRKEKSKNLELAYNSVVNMIDGDYDCWLGNGKTQKAVPLQVRGKENYVLLRVGSDAEDLVVFPPVDLQQSGASRAVFTTFMILPFMWVLGQ